MGVLGERGGGRWPRLCPPRWSEVVGLTWICIRQAATRHLLGFVTCTPVRGRGRGRGGDTASSCCRFCRVLFSWGVFSMYFPRPLLHCSSYCLRLIFFGVRVLDGDGRYHARVDTPREHVVFPGIFGDFVLGTVASEKIGGEVPQVCMQQLLRTFL